MSNLYAKHTLGLCQTRLAFVCAWLTVAACLALSGCKRSDKATEQKDGLAAVIMQVSGSAKLYTSEVQVHKIVLFDDETHLKGKLLSNDFDLKLPVGERRVAIPIDATLKAYVDFSRFSAHNVRTDSVNGQRILTITLPDPQLELTASKIDHVGTKEYVALTRSDFSHAELAQFTRQGLQQIIQSVPQMGLVETCRQQAANVLIPMFARLGYNEAHVKVVFREGLDEDDAPALIKVMN